jgi:transposase-like protein
MTGSSSKYPEDLQERAVRRVAERRSEFPSEGATIAAVAAELGIQGHETLRGWVKKACSKQSCRTSAERRCRGCKCGGAFHGSARYTRSAPEPEPAGPSPVSRPSQRKTVRNLALTVTAAAVVTAGWVSVTGSASSGSAASRGNLSVQVKVDLTKALRALSSVLGFRSSGLLNAQTDGPTYHADCAATASGKVKLFLAANHCVKYATAIRAVAREGNTIRLAFSWVEMPTVASADKYKKIVDVHKTGNPPGVQRAFDGYCYASGQQGATVWTVLVQPSGHVEVDQEILSAAAPTRLSASYLQRHCIR